MHDAGPYAQLFARAMRSPLDTSDDDIAKLTPADRALLELRIDAEVDVINRRIVRSLGGVPPAPKHRVSDARLAQLEDLVRRGSVLDISATEWRMLCANGEQLDQLVAAAAEAA